MIAAIHLSSVTIPTVNRPNVSSHTMQTFQMVGSCTEELTKPLSCQKWGVGTHAGIRTCLGEYDIV